MLETQLNEKYTDFNAVVQLKRKKDFSRNSPKIHITIHDKIENCYRIIDVPYLIHKYGYNVGLSIINYIFYENTIK